MVTNKEYFVQYTKNKTCQIYHIENACEIKENTSK